MNFRQRLQDGQGRLWATGVLALAVLVALVAYWPSQATERERIMNGAQKVAFAAAAFAVTAYNLRTRVVDLVLKVEGSPSKIDEFCRIARTCGRRLTNLVVMFTLTTIWLGSLTLFPAGGAVGRFASAVALSLFTASTVSFFYILFAFERLERFALDEAERQARQREASRLANG